MRAIVARGEGPGEVAGPAVALTLLLENRSGRTVDLGAVVVVLEDSRGDAAGEILGNPAEPLSGALRDGRRAAGTYVFSVAKDRRRPIMVRVTLGSKLPTLSYAGNLR